MTPVITLIGSATWTSAQFSPLKKQALQKLQQTGDTAMQQLEVPHLKSRDRHQMQPTPYIPYIPAFELTMSMFLKVLRTETNFCLSSKKLLKSQGGMDLSYLKGVTQLSLIIVRFITQDTQRMF